MNSSDNRRSLLLSAALGVTCGVIAGAAMIACREKEKPKAIPVAEVGIAKPTSPSAIRSRIEEPVLANDRVAVDSLLREHPDALPIARDQ